MHNGFFNHPLWLRCHDRPIWVVSLSEPEHRLRDARALIQLRDFLPPHCTFANVTLDAGEPRWPTIPSNAAIVLLGRPSLIGSEAEQLLKKAQPPLLFHFLSDKRSDDPLLEHEYRSIVERHFHEVTHGDTFERQRERNSKELDDLGIIYCGQAEDRPIFLFAGSSTVGTWGAVSYACESVTDEDDLRWHQDIQGVVRCRVRNAREAFDRISVTVNGPLLAPARIWMCGRDLPPIDKWRNALQICDNAPNGTYDLQILCNGHEIKKTMSTPIAALALLAWASKRSRKAHDFFLASTTVSDVVRSLQHFDGFEQRHEPAIRAALKSLVKQIRKQGGIAYEERLSIEAGNQEPQTRFWLCARNLPSFLPDRL